MQKRYTQFLAALHTTRQFLDAKGTALGPISSTGARKTLDEMTEAIEQLAEAQDTHRMLVKGRRKEELRLAEAFRRKFLRPIIEIVQAKLPDDVQLLSEVRLPRGAVSSTALASKGHAIAKTVAPFAQVFIDAGLATDFVAQLTAAADRLAEAVANKGQHRAGRTGATEGLNKQVRKARRAVRVLDAMVKANLQLGEPLVTEWREAVRVIRGGTRQQATNVAEVQRAA